MQRILVNDAEIRHPPNPGWTSLTRSPAAPRPSTELPRDIDMETPLMPLESLSASNGGLDQFLHHRAARDRRPAQAVPGRQPAAQPERQQRRDALHHACGRWTRRAASSAFSADARADDAAPGRVRRGGGGGGYLDSIKVQFDAGPGARARRGRQRAIGARLPRELFRFQRRNAFRVRPLLRSSPLARVRHPAIAEMSSLAL